jgi:glutamine synthetase
MLPAETQRIIDKHGIKYVLAQFVDIHGAAKTKSVPICGLKTVAEEGAGFAGFAISGMGMEPHGPDFMARGDLSTLTPVPWQAGYGRVVCVGHVDGKPHPYDSRYVLQQQIRRLEDKGWTLNTGLEPEFNLMRRDEQGKLQLVDLSDNLDKPSFAWPPARSPMTWA